MHIQRILIAIILFVIPSISLATDAVNTKQHLLFGQTAALSGTSANLGTGMQDGIMAAFKEVNDQGGIDGKLLTLISYDDKYDPELAVINTKKILEEKHVFAMIGSAGTTVVNALIPLLASERIPLIGSLSGAEILRAPELSYVVNIRASYEQETEKSVAYLVDSLKKQRIAVLYQDDSFGRDGLAGVEKALKKRQLNLIGTATYARNTTAIKGAALKLQNTNPDAIIIVGVSKPTVEFIKFAKEIKFDNTFVTLSPCGMELVTELGAVGEGVIMSQVVPLPSDAKIPIVAAYQKALNAYNPALAYDFISLEGYIVGKFNIMVLKNMTGEISREGYLHKMIELGIFDIDGIKLTFKVNDNQGMDDVFLTRINKNGGLDTISE